MDASLPGELARTGTIRNPADAEALFQALMAGITDYAILVLDPEGNVAMWNDGARKLKGYEADEIVGRNFSIFYTQEDQAEGVPQETLRMAASEGTFEDESLRVRKDGSTFWASQVVSAIRDAEGGLTGFVKVTRDITARKAVEDEIQDYVERLRRSNQELDDFAYIASHDLKEPIRGLSNNAKFLQEDFAEVVGDGGRRRLDRMIYLCSRMEALVDDLLYFSRLSRQDLAVQKVDLNGVVRDIELMMETTLREKNATIAIPQPLPTIVCDVPRITEVFRNLITNAVKYNDKPVKRVEVGVASGEGETRVFYVRDNGMGIEQRFFSDVFRIFKRLNEEDDSVKGTGVGLTFVKKIIERHGGRIWLESEPGQGTTFFFTLPGPGGQKRERVST
jgi:PAS domain S-box-containing protein